MEILWRIYESEKMGWIGKDSELALGNVNGISVSIGKLIQYARGCFQYELFNW